MKKALLFIVSVCLVAALLIFSGASGRGPEATNIKGVQTAKATESASPSQAENVLKIGVPAALTGTGSTDDARILLGLHYARSVSPTVEIGGVTYKVELVETDTGGTKAGAENVAKILSEKKVAAVIGSFASGNAQASLPLFDKAGIPTLALCCTNAEAGRDNALFFRLSGTDTLYGGAAANLAQSLEKRSAAVLTDSTDVSSQALGQAFTEAFQKLGGTCKSFSYISGKKDYAALAQAVQSSGANVVFMASGAETGEDFLREARRQGVLCPVIGPAGWDAGLLLSDADYYSDSIYAVADYDGCGTDRVSSDFAARFSAWVHDEKDASVKNGGSTYASSYSALGYDAYMLLLKAFRSAGSTDAKAISEAIHKTDYSGVTGAFSFDKSGNAMRTTTCVKTIDRKSARFDLVKSISVGG